MQITWWYLKKKYKIFRVLWTYELWGVPHLQWWPTCCAWTTRHDFWLSFNNSFYLREWLPRGVFTQGWLKISTQTELLLTLVRWDPTLSFATVPLAENAGQAADNPCQQHTDHSKYPHVCEDTRRALARFIIIRVECWGSKRFLGRSQNWKIMNMF